MLSRPFREPKQKKGREYKIIDHSGIFYVYRKTIFGRWKEITKYYTYRGALQHIIQEETTYTVNFQKELSG